MFKRIKGNKTFIKIKELWQNDKTHPFVVLGLWLVFFVIAILFVRGTANHPNANSENNIGTDFNTIKSYSFSYQYENNEINGNVYNDKIEFILDNHRYYYNENLYLVNGDTLVKQDLNYDILKINSIMLNNLLGKLTGVKNDGFTRYLVPLDRFINLFEIDTDADLSLAMNYNIVVDVYKKDNIINKVVLDLTNYRIFRFNNINIILFIMFLYFFCFIYSFMYKNTNKSTTAILAINAILLLLKIDVSIGKFRKFLYASTIPFKIPVIDIESSPLIPWYPPNFAPYMCKIIFNII